MFNAVFLTRLTSVGTEACARVAAPHRSRGLHEVGTKTAAALAVLFRCHHPGGRRNDPH
jgi:hypothetical protein